MNFVSYSPFILSLTNLFRKTSNFPSEANDKDVIKQLKIKNILKRNINFIIKFFFYTSNKLFQYPSSIKGKELVKDGVEIEQSFTT